MQQSQNPLIITKSFNNHGTISTRKDIVRVGNILLDDNIISSEVISALKNDLEIIGSLTELQLMEGKQNGLKGAKLS